MGRLTIETVVTGKSDVDQLRASTDKLDKSVDTLAKDNTKLSKSTKDYSAILTKANVALVAFGASMTKVMSDGFSFNSEMEQSIAGLKALSVATQDKALPVLERYNRAQKEATSTMKELQRINTQTPHTLNQTNQIYRAMYVSMKAAGASTTDMVELTRSLSIASGAAGIQFQSLLAGVDGLATGTVMANSDLGRFLSSLGLTNETLKDTDDVVGLVKDAMKDFKAAGTMAESISNLENAYDQLAGTLSIDIFENAKDGANGFAAILNKLNDELVDYRANVEDIRDIHKLNTLGDAKRELGQLLAVYQDLINDGVGLLQSQEGYNAEVKEAEFLISSLQRKIERLSEAERVQTVEVKKKTAATKDEIEAMEEAIQKAKEYQNALSFDMIIQGDDAQKRNSTTEAKYEKLRDDRITKELKDKKALEKANKKEADAAIKAEKDKADAATKKAKNDALIMNTQITAYATLAGAMSTMFDQGSKEAEAFAVAQATLGIVNAYVAITTAMATPPAPAGIALGAMVATQVLPIIATLSTLGGSGGGGGGSVSIPSSAEMMQQELDFTTGFELEQLDRQIELLEAISENTEGTVGRLSVLQSGKQLDYDIEGVRISFREMFEENAGAMGMTDAVNYYAPNQGLTNDVIKYLQGGSSGLDPLYSSGMFDFGMDKYQFQQLIGEAQDAVQEYAMGTIEVANNIIDAGDVLKDAYDNITQSDYFELERFKQAQEDMDRIKENGTVEDYLITQIEAIDEFEKNLDMSLVSLLSSTDVQLLDEQIAAVAALGVKTDQVFENGVEEALNYLDSINMVADAMANSVENIKDWEDSFKTEGEMLGDLSEKFGYAISSSMEDLHKLFEVMKGTDGLLTDNELDFLQKNKDLLDSQASALNNAVENIGGAIQRLVGSATDNNGLSSFYESMNETIKLSEGSDIKAFTTSLDDTIGLSNTLQDSKNFGSAADQKFAQLVAANQFDQMQTGILNQIDWLENINTNIQSGNEILTEVNERLYEIERIQADTRDNTDQLVQGA